jgi:hypothetical protein
MSKYVFLVGIDEYDKAIFGDIDLHGCINDIVKAETFLNSEGVLFTRLQNSEARKQTMLFCLNEYASTLQPGDELHFYFSGHGTRFEKDGKVHTARVMHDDILPDYEITPILAKFKAGVTVILYSDSCYSTGNSRTAAKPPAANAVRRSIEAPKIFIENAVEYTDPRKYAATIYYFSACEHNEVAWEIGGIGNFTQTLAILLRGYKQPTAITTIFKTLKKSIAHQHPTLQTKNKSKAKVPKI